MMGLTVACARCHDHKFDPIPSRDYYSLFGIFASSVEPEQEPLLGIDVPEKEHQEYLAEHKKRGDALDKYRKEQERAMAAQLRSQSGEYLLAAYEARESTNKDENRWNSPHPQVGSGHAASVDYRSGWLAENFKTPYSRPGSPLAI